jgi:hypothetical protein
MRGSTRLWMKRFFASLPEDPWARYLADEGRSTGEAFRRGAHAALQADSLGALVFGRLVLESTIRMFWLGADLDDEEATKVRLGRLEKRDLSQLLKASDAMSSMSVAAPLVTDAETLKEILQEMVERPLPSRKRWRRRRAQLRCMRSTGTLPPPLIQGSRHVLASLRACRLMRCSSHQIRILGNGLHDRCDRIDSRRQDSRRSPEHERTDDVPRRRAP